MQLWPTGATVQLWPTGATVQLWPTGATVQLWPPGVVHYDLQVLLCNDDLQVWCNMTYRWFCAIKSSGCCYMTVDSASQISACIYQCIIFSFNKTAYDDPAQHGGRNLKDTNPLLSSSLVILFGVVKQFGRFWIWSETECKIPAEYGLD